MAQLLPHFLMPRWIPLIRHTRHHALDLIPSTLDERLSILGSMSIYLFVRADRGERELAGCNAHNWAYFPTL